MQGPVGAPRRAALGLALALLWTPAAALEIGDVRVRSALGDPFDAVVPLSLAAGEWIDGSCFSIRRPGTSAPVPPLSYHVHTARGAKELRLRTRAPMAEPAFALEVRAACAGITSPVERQFAILVDPPRRTTATAGPPAATLRAQEGDTLASFAAKVFPREGAQRERYLAALRRANPSLAARADDAPLTPGSAVVLPDLRLAGAPSPAPAARPVAAVTPPPAAPARRSYAIGAGPPSMPLPAEAPPPPKPAAAPAPVASTRPAPATAQASIPAPAPFALRLSGPALDLAPSRGLDAAARARLRDRRAVLDADDHTAAYLALRNQVRQLEARIAELQLKLSTQVPVPAKPAPDEAPKAAKAPEAQRPAEPKAAAAKPAVTGPPVAPKPAAPKTASAKPAAPADTGLDPLLLWLALAAVLAALAGVGTWLWRRRRRAAATHDAATELVLDTPERDIEAADLEAPEFDVVPDLEPPRDNTVRTEVIAAPPAAAAPAAAPSPSPPAAPAEEALSTRLPEDSRELRRRYIEERFPEIANRTLVLDDPGSVIKAARLLYEEGAMPRAVELLQYCIEERPGEVRLWLALFEIYRLERLTEAYAALAERFGAAHGQSDAWRKVRYFGREIDPGNPLYADKPLDTLQTIGPREARALAAAAVDPIAENWLEAPMDFENDVLANELRQALMARAKLREQDLAPDPIPLLRSSETFTVA